MSADLIRSETQRCRRSNTKHWNPF